MPWHVLEDEQILAAATRTYGRPSISPFYSNPVLTLREGALYVVGLNPGGDPLNTESQRRVRPCDNPSAREDWCSYLDETWPSQLQSNIKHIATEALGGQDELRKAFCSNAIFVRGTLSDVIASGLWGVCKPWHSRWLAVVKPPIVICFSNKAGMSAYAYFSALVGGDAERNRLAAYGSFSLKWCDGAIEGVRVSVVGLPHLSRWSPRSEKSLRVVDKVRDVVREAYQRRGLARRLSSEV